jgi:hypothetical protein
MAQTITPELACALLGGEPLYLVVYGKRGIGGSITKPLYAVPLRDCACPATQGRTDFDIPPLVPNTDVTIMRVFYAVERSRVYVELQEVEVTSLPMTLRAGDVFKLSGLYISIS